MLFEYKITVEVERESGKFAGRDEIDDVIRQAIEDGVQYIDLSGLGADGTSVYTVTDTTVD